MTEYQFKYYENNKLRWFNFDFYIKKYNIDIEYNGSAWHYNPIISRQVHTVKSKQQLKDQDEHRQKVLELNNIKMFIIWNYEIKEYNIDVTLQKLYNNIKEYIHEKFE